jgi:predicted Zn-dependent peptidase
MQTGTLANGIAVVHYQTEGAPLVYVAASATGGARSNPRGQEGLLALAAQMAPNGAGGRDLEAFGKAAKDLGADISTRLDAQRSSIVLSVPPANFGAGVGLLADAVRDPNFDEEAWQVLMAETLDYLGAREGDVADVARRALNEAIFPVGPGEPALESSFESVRAISLEDAKNAFAELFTPQTMTIYSVGDLPLETVLNSLDAQFGDWQSNSPGIEARPDPPAVFPEAQRLILVPDPGTTQAMISVARPTPGFDEPNQAEAVAVMRLLGYDFISRLNAVIREEKGYSYGVDAQAWESLRERAALIVDAPVQSELVGPALKEFFTGFESLASEPIRKDELNRTITAYQLILAGTAETGSGLFDAVLSSAGTGFSLEEVLARQRAMTELDLEAVRREAQSLSSLDHAVIVIVGDPDAVLPQLSALGLGEVEVLEREF